VNSCRLANIKTGTYCYKYSQGLFTSCITLNDDSSFKYEFGGDLISRNGEGVYRRLSRKKVELKFLKPITSSRFTHDKKMRLVYTDGKLTKIVDEAINKCVIDTFSSAFNLAILNGKVYFTDSNYKVTKFKTRSYLYRRRFILFGRHYGYRNNYLVHCKD